MCSECTVPCLSEVGRVPVLVVRYPDRPLAHSRALRSLLYRVPRLVVVGLQYESRVTIRLEVVVVHMRTRLIELVTTYVCKLREGELAALAANLDCARRGFAAQTFPLCLARQIVNQQPPRAIIRLP
jgi:hypothetical protein